MPTSAGTMEVVSTHGVPMCTEFGLAADYKGGKMCQNLPNSPFSTTIWGKGFKILYNYIKTK